MSNPNEKYVGKPSGKNLIDLMREVPPIDYVVKAAATTAAVQICGY